MFFRAVIVSLGYLWLDLRILFASNSLKLCSSYFSSPVLAIIVKNEKKNAFLKINFYIKISKNLGGNFSNLGSNCLDIWQFFRNFLAFQKASFQHFTSTIGTALSCQQWFLQAGRCATKEEKPLRATVCFSIEHARPRDITFSCKKHQQNNNFARTSQFFVHFFPFLHDYDVKKKCLILLFLWRT